jgi:dTDP-4-dehydrorhamnose reductase
VSVRIAVLGAAGQLGQALVAELRAHDVVGTVRRTPQPGEALLDLAEHAKIASALSSIDPEVVVVAAAMCHVDGCEQDPAACRAVNVDGTRAVAEWVRDAGGRLVFFSTDHVFDGSAAEHGEDDPVRPLNEYARSKVAAETLLRDILPERHVILRTAWLYGPDPARRNFALRLVARMAAGERMQVPADQWGAPTYAPDLAAITRHFVEQGTSGTFHVTGADFLDRVTLARRICARFGVDPAGIVPTPTADLRQPAPRPLRVRLRRSPLPGAPPMRDLAGGLDALHAWATARKDGA